MAKTKNIPRIERGATRIVVPHEKGEIAFIHPCQGPGNYQTVGKGILARNLKIPSAEHTASLLYAAYCDDSIANEPEFKEIRDIIRNKWIWVFNRNLWTPEGVYVVSDSDAVGTSQKLNPRELEEKLSNSSVGSPICYSSDRTIRFAPKESYKLGDHTTKSLAEDGFIIASFGEEGAEKLGEVGSKFTYAPRIWGVEVSKGEEPIQKVSALYRYHSRLNVYGLNHDYYRNGCAFGGII